MPQYFNNDDKNRIRVSEGKVERAFEVTPSDSVDLDYPTIAVYVGETGDLKVDLVDGGTITLKNLVAGAFHPIACKKIYSTDTTCTEIVGVY